MTTLDPGASVVLTQGFRLSPASTAFLASSAAPTMTDGLEVLVHEVMAAITTDPWSMVTVVPSSSVAWVALDGLPAGSSAIGSEAGKVSATPSSCSDPGTYAVTASRKAFLASERATRSCGRFGPAIDGTMVDRSRS